MSDLGLEQALAVGDEDEAAEATGADASGGLRPIPDLRAAAGRGETVQQEPHVGVGDSITEDVEPGQQGRQPHSATPYYKLLAFYQQRDMADLGACGRGEADLTLLIGSDRIGSHALT